MPITGSALNVIHLWSGQLSRSVLGNLLVLFLLLSLAISCMLWSEFVTVVSDISDSWGKTSHCCNTSYRRYNLGLPHLTCWIVCWFSRRLNRNGRRSFAGPHHDSLVPGPSGLGRWHRHCVFCRHQSAWLSRPYSTESGRFQDRALARVW